MKPKKQTQEMDMMKLIEQFGSEDKCRAYLEGLRWPDGVKCLRCQGDKISRIYERNQFHCDSCSYQFSVKTGTIFHDSHLPFTKWFVAVYLMSESKKGVSALQLKRNLGVAYKTAWYLCHRVRTAVKEADSLPLSAIAECDETFVGGKAKNMHKKDKERREIGRGGKGKTIVLTAIVRRGGVRMRKEQNRETETLHSFIKKF